MYSPHLGELVSLNHDRVDSFLDTLDLFIRFDEDGMSAKELIKEALEEDGLGEVSYAEIHSNVFNERLEEIRGGHPLEELKRGLIDRGFLVINSSCNSLKVPAKQVPFGELCEWDTLPSHYASAENFIVEVLKLCLSGDKPSSYLKSRIANQGVGPTRVYWGVPSPANLSEYLEFLFHKTETYYGNASIRHIYEQLEFAQINVILGSDVRLLPSGLTGSPLTSNIETTKQTARGVGMFNMNKMMDQMFRKAEDVVWDLTTGKLGVKSDDTIITAEQDDELGWITSENMFSDFGMSIPAFATATPLGNVKEGDMVMDKNGVAGWVTQKGKATFKLLKVNGQNTKWTPPKKMVNGNSQTVMVVQPLMGDGLSGMQNSLMPMALMLQEGGGSEDELSSMIPLMMMQSGMMQGEGQNQNMLQNMLMMKAMSGGGDAARIMPFMMMQNGGMMGGDGNMNPMMMAMMMKNL